MRSGMIHLIEMMIGAIVLAFGISYLVVQIGTMNQLLVMIGDKVLKTRDIYDQSSEIAIYEVSDEELYAMIMGYREYPIIIDGNLVKTDGTDYEAYSSYIKDDFYTKCYVYDSQHCIKQIVFNHRKT